MKKRIDRLEQVGNSKKYVNGIVLINEGDPLPENLSPDAIVIVNTITEADYEKAN